jgi:intracellular septation protein A
MRTFLIAARPIVFDMLATIAFAGLLALTGNAVLATVAAMAMGAGQATWEKLRGKPVPALQWASLGLVTVLGGATLFTGDPRFVMIKPTIVYLTVGAAMLQRGWMVRYMPPRALEFLPRRLIDAGGYVWAGLMFATAAANLVIALTLPHAAWIAFIGVFPLTSKLALFLVHYASFRLIAGRNARAQEAPLAEPA